MPSKGNLSENLFRGEGLRNQITIINIIVRMSVFSRKSFNSYQSTNQSNNHTLLQRHDDKSNSNKKMIL